METLCDRGMVMQVQATFAGGLSEHLQAAGGANASVTASLRESLGTAAQLVDDLKTDIHEGQNKLIHLASQKSKPALCSELPILFLHTCFSSVYFVCGNAFVQVHRLCQLPLCMLMPCLPLQPALQMH